MKQLFVALVLLLVAAGCGDDDDGNAAATSVLGDAGISDPDTNEGDSSEDPSRDTTTSTTSEAGPTESTAGSAPPATTDTGSTATTARAGSSGADAVPTPSGSDPLIDAFTEFFVSDPTFFGDEGDARCISTSIVQGIGADRLAALGVTPDNVDITDPFGDMTPPELDAYSNAIGDCVDADEVMATAWAGDDAEALVCARAAVNGNGRAMIRYEIDPNAFDADPPAELGPVYDALLLC